MDVQHNSIVAEGRVVVSADKTGYVTLEIVMLCRTKHVFIGSQSKNIYYSILKTNILDEGDVYLIVPDQPSNSGLERRKFLQRYKCDQGVPYC